MLKIMAKSFPTVPLNSISHNEHIPLKEQTRTRDKTRKRISEPKHQSDQVGGRCGQAPVSQMFRMNSDRYAATL